MTLLILYIITILITIGAINQENIKSEDPFNYLEYMLAALFAPVLLLLKLGSILSMLHDVLNNKLL